MKNSAAVKIISLILCAVMLMLSLPLSVIAETGGTPVIYVGGMSENTIYLNPDKTDSAVAHSIYSKEFLKQMSDLLGVLIMTSFDGIDVESKTPDVINIIKNIMEPIKCSETGVPFNGNTGVRSYPRPVAEYNKDEVYTENMQALIKAAEGRLNPEEIFWFSYDWRLDPIANAEKLRDFIDYVKAETGKSRISVLSSANGGTVVNAYLYSFSEHAAASLKNCVFLNAPLLGSALAGDIMTGSLARTAADEDSIIDIVGDITGAQRGEAFFRYIEDDPLGLFAQISEYFLGPGSKSTLIGRLAWIVASNILKGEDIHKDLGKAYNQFALISDDAVYSGALSGYLRNIPGLWAVVPEKDFETAKEFLFDRREAPPELEKKINSFRKVINSTEQTFNAMRAVGVDIYIVSSYGLQLMPVTVSLNDMSDGVESVKYSSCGAALADGGNAQAYNRCTLGHNHMSPDGDIDASACFLPENTWFIKGLAHNSYSSDAAAQFIVWLLTGDNNRSIYENSDYPQYMEYSVYSARLIPCRTSGGEEWLYGDVTGDFAVNASDARKTLRMSVGLDEAASDKQLTAADVDGDNKVSAADARLILRFSVSLINIFPVEQKAV